MVAFKKINLLKKLLSIALLSSLLLLGAFSYPSSTREALASPSLESIIASLVPDDPPGVSNPDALIGDREILQALDFWIRGRPVPGMGQAISDMQILTLLDAWIKQRAVATLPPVEQISKIVGSKGGTIETKSGTKVSVDAGILRQDAPVSVTVTAVPTEPLPDGVSMVGNEIQIELPAQALALSLDTRSKPLQVPADENGITIEIPLPAPAAESQLVYVTVYQAERGSTALQARYLPAVDLSKVWEGIGKVGQGAKQAIVNVGKSAWAGVKTGAVWVKAMVVDVGLKIKQAYQYIRNKLEELSLYPAVVQLYQQLGLVPRDLGLVIEPMDKNANPNRNFDFQEFLNGSKHVLILVHGIQPFGQKLEWYVITAEAWEEFTTFFYGDQELRATYELFSVEYVTSNPIKNNGQELAKVLNPFINSIRRANPSRKIVILAHSMGGLVAKSAMLEHGAVPDAVITLGTPHHGSPLANIPSSLVKKGLLSCSVSLGQNCGELGFELLIRLFLETPGFQQLKWDGFDGKLKGTNDWLSKLNQNNSFDDHLIAYASKKSNCTGKLLGSYSLLKLMGWGDTGDCVVPYSSGSFLDKNGQSRAKKVVDTTPVDHNSLLSDKRVLELVRQDLCEIADGCKVKSIPPTANFTFAPSSPKINETVQFTDQSSDPDNDIQSWFWDFGDRTTSSSRNPTHAYSRSGSFTVTLTVRDKAGNTATVQKTVNVQEKPNPFVYISKTIRSDSDSIIDLTSSNPNDGSRDVIFRVTITNDGNADARVRVVDDMAGGAYRCADPNAPCERDNILVKAQSNVVYDYRARYVGSETRDGAVVVNTARIVWIDGYYDESRHIDLGGHGTLSSSVTAYLHNPPKARPEIISVDFPSEIPADTPVSGRVNFRDRDGDINWIEFRDTASGSITGAWDPGVLGNTSGSIGFDHRCNTPQTFTIRVILRDQAGNESDPAYFTFECVKRSSPPEILSIDFPAEIPNNGSRINGTVRFRDPDGDINWVRFETLSGNFTPFSFDPEVSGQTSGSFGFLIWCNETQTVTVRVILQDQAGNESAPFDFTFRCVPPVGPPVITRIDFPGEIFANSQPVEGRVYFTSLGSNVNRAKFEVLSGTWNPLDFNPAPYLVSGTLQQGVFTFAVRCNSPEVGRFRVTLYNEAGLASYPEEFSFLCRPIQDEICGNGIDDDGDGYIDEGCPFKISMLLQDSGDSDDDIFRLYVDGEAILPETPRGKHRYYDLGMLSSGYHTVEVYVVDDINPPGTFKLTLYGGAVFRDGSTAYDCTVYDTCPNEGESLMFIIIVP